MLKVLVPLIGLVSAIAVGSGSAEARTSSPLPVYTTSSIATALTSPNVIALGPVNHIYAIDS